MREPDIDAGEALDERDRERGTASETEPAEVEGARGPAAFAPHRRAWPVGARSLFLVLGLMMAGIVTMLLMKARSVHQETEARHREASAGDDRVEKRMPGLKLALSPPVPPSPAPPSAPEEAHGTPSPPAQPSGEMEILQRRLSPGFGAHDGEGAGPGDGPPTTTTAPNTPDVGAPTAGPRSAGGLEEKLEATSLQAASAGRLPDRDYLLTQGAMLDCVLETKIVSTVPGMTACHLTRDIYSTNGRVVLLDRGSRVVGRYEAGMQQGETRIFVLWTRVETPAGVVVELQSPGTGPLGEAGVGGWVDTRFRDRFGAAILLSIIGGGLDAATVRAAGQSRGTTFNVSGTTNAGKDVIAKSMEPTINIPPILYKNQGERVAIFVARDLDFRSVYGLERNARSEERQAGP